MVRLLLRFFTLCVGATLAVGCGATAPAVSGSATQPSLSVVRSGSVPLGLDSPQQSGTPQLIAGNSNLGVLQSWPLDPKGGSHPQTISKSLGISYYGMAANGNVVAIADGRRVIVYNVATKSKTMMANPYGFGIDIAIDKNASLYVINIAKPVGNVTMYPQGMPQPTKLVCRYVGTPEYVAVDNEGDIFVNGYGRAGYPSVIEIPNGPNGPDPQNCSIVPIRPEGGYVGGVAIDPKTDDLIVLDNPSQCAGGVEGRMTIYSKPYQKSTAVTRYLNANCAGGLRLDATSSTVFVGDSDVSGSYTYILQRTYPDGEGRGAYYGGRPGGFTTIPNTLPN